MELKPAEALTNETEAPHTEAGETDAATRRANAYRERFRRSQVIAGKIAAARAAGGAPNDSDAARLVAEFHARGGRVTVCPEIDPAEQERAAQPKRRGD
jgi:hypothetical protein